MKTKNLKLLAIFIALFYLTSTAFTTTDLPRSSGKWVSFESDIAKVKIKFPGEISVIDETLDNGQRHISAKYQPLSGNMFMLDVIQHVVELGDRDNLDEVSLDSFFENLGVGEVPFEEFILGDYKGVKSKVNLDEMGITIDYRVVIIGQRQMQAVVMMKTSNWDQKVANKFFKSWKILK